MIEELRRKSDSTFDLKAGTLYPLLHNLEKDGIVSAYEDSADSERVRKYYHLSKKGKRLLTDKQSEWNAYSKAVQKVLNGGECYDAV
jgi:PadR family transcriptional regulator PadR